MLERYCKYCIITDNLDLAETFKAKKFLEDTHF